jgi:hypothetical protein
VIEALLILIPSGDGCVPTAASVVVAMLQPIPRHNRSASDIIMGPRPDDLKYMLFYSDEIIVVKPRKAC